jgi:Holliday junction resolvase
MAKRERDIVELLWERDEAVRRAGSTMPALPAPKIKGE